MGRLEGKAELSGAGYDQPETPLSRSVYRMRSLDYLSIIGDSNANGLDRVPCQM